MVDFVEKPVQSCMHCHQIRDAERLLYFSARKPFPDQVFYPYPDPEVLGLRMDPAEMARITRVAAGSPGDRAGLKVGDDILSLDGQPLLSVADLQWVLHNAPASVDLPVQVRRDGKTINFSIALTAGWRRGNISWRVTTWQLRQMGFKGMKLDSPKNEDFERTGLRKDRLALLVAHVGEHGEHGIAKRAGIQKGDIVVSSMARNSR
jgi:hypothetical protein